MTTPQDIPPGMSEAAWDVAIRAAELLDDDYAIGSWSVTRLAECIARATLAATLAEREACALLIDEGFDRVGVKTKYDECDHGRFGYEDCEQCASAAIRKRGEV